MKIGWYSELPGYVGGAQANAAALYGATPQGVELTWCSENYAPDCDAYIVHNCTHLDRRHIKVFEKKPTIKCICDIWKAGDPVLRSWFLEHATRLVFVSPLQLDYMNLDIEPERLLFSPSAIDTTAYRKAAAAYQGERKGAYWLGRMEAGKGLEKALAWADSTGADLDCYGYGSLIPLAGKRYKGPLDHEQTLVCAARHKTFVFLPTEFDSCPRVVFEAWAAGCNLLVNGMQGASWWLENDPIGVEMAAQRFWSDVMDVLKTEVS